MRRSRIFAIAAFSVAAIAVSPAVAAAESITGAGSTLVAPLEAQWAAGFQASSGNQVIYGAVGSGAGIAQITARTVDFGASDAPLTPAQAAACNACVQIPWGLTATGIAYNIPGVSNLKLTGAVLSQIYLGHITNWNDASIKRLNPHITLPNLKVTPVFRSDGSGDTYAFTDWLSRVNAGWRTRVGFGTAVGFKAGVGGKGNDGITALVGSTSGAIGYISASYIIAHHLRAAALQNESGKFEFPNLKNISAAASVVKSVPANNELHIVDPPRTKAARVAYPLSTFTYAIVPRTIPKKATVVAFIKYALTTGQAYGAALDFAPIPGVVLKASLNTLNALP